MNKSRLWIATWVLWWILAIWSTPELIERVRGLFNNLVPETNASLVVQWPNLKFEIPSEVKVIIEEPKNTETKIGEITKKSKKLKIDVRNEEPKALVTLGKKVKNPFGPWDEVPILFESPTWRWSITMFLRYSSEFESWVACEYTSLILPWNEPATEEIKWITLIAPKWTPMPWTEKRLIEIVDINNPTSYEETIATISEKLSKRPWIKEDI